MKEINHKTNEKRGELTRYNILQLNTDKLWVIIDQTNKEDQKDRDRTVPMNQDYPDIMNDVLLP